MGLQELIERVRLCCLRTAGTDRSQQIAKLICGRSGESIEAVRHDVHAGAVGQLELDGEAARIGAANRVGDVRNASEVRESHRDRKGPVGEYSSLRKLPSFRGRRK